MLTEKLKSRQDKRDYVEKNPFHSRKRTKKRFQPFYFLRLKKGEKMLTERKNPKLVKKLIILYARRKFCSLAVGNIVYSEPVRFEMESKLKMTFF